MILRQSGIRYLVALLTPSIMEQKSSTTSGDGSVWSLHDLSPPYNGTLSFFMEITCCCDLMFLLQNFMPMIALSYRVIGSSVCSVPAVGRLLKLDTKCIIPGCL